MERPLIHLPDPVERSHPLNLRLGAWWMALPGLSGGSTLVDLLGRHHGGLTGMAPESDWQPTDRPGGWGQLDLVSASSQSVIVPSAIVTGYPFTLSIWVRPDALTGVMLSTMRTNTAFWYGHYLDISSSKAQAVSVVNNAFRVSASAANLTAGQWQQVTGVFRSATNRQVYVDGVPGTLNTESSSPTAMVNTVVSGSKRSTHTNFFDGRFDCARIWHRDLSPEEVLELNRLDRRYSEGLLRLRRRTAVSVAATGTGLIQPAGIASAEAFGTARLTQVIAPAGIASAEAFGTTALTQVIQPAGIASGEAFGTAALTQVIAPAGIASAEAFGTTALTQVITPAGIASAEAFGTTALTQVIAPAGIASGEAFGTARVTEQGVIAPDGIPSAEAFGTAALTQVIAPDGIASAEAFGTATLTQVIAPEGIASAEAFGTALLVPEGTILPAGIASAEAFGTATVTAVATELPAPVMGFTLPAKRGEFRLPRQTDEFSLPAQRGEFTLRRV